MKKSELTTLIKEVKQELNENYYFDQLAMAEKDHDWKMKMKMKFFGSKNDSKFLSIDQKTFNKIKALIKKL